jgi:putative nucleotidyltransferase with HDIG domain
MDDRLTRLLDRPEVGVVRAVAHAMRAPVLLVGGAVRDALLGRDEPRDLDFAVQGDATALARAVADALYAGVYVMDAERGTTRVLVPSREPGVGPHTAPALILDFAVCRGATWPDDLFARDFSINAIAVDLQNGQLVDDTGGQVDLSARVVRATSDHALTDDPVRGLRAVRLAFQLGMRIEPTTLSLVYAVGATILEPSAERVRDELVEILGLPDASKAIRLLDEVGMLGPILPEIEPMRGCEQSPPHHFTVIEHTYRVMEALDREMSNPGFDIEHVRFKTRDPRALLRLATLLHDCGKPMTRTVGADGRVRFFEHETVGAELAAARARALRLSGAEVSAVRMLVRIHMRPNQMAREMARTGQPPSLRTWHRFFREAGECAPLLAPFAIADCLGKRGDQTRPDDCDPSRRIAALLIKRYFERYEASVAPAALVTGRDVLELGVKPGPRIGAILEAVREAQMAGEVGRRDEALALARALARAQASTP